ncbi:MAG: nitrate- and nitrite sensing domain-containing protein [Pseudonocardiaceae bacterium]
MTALSFGGAPGVAVLGGDLPQLRRRGGRWRLRDWRLCTKLTAVLLVPLLLAAVLGALRVADSLREADGLDAAARQLGFAEQLGLAVYDLQRERHLVAEVVATGKGADSTALQAQTQWVDFRVNALRAAGSGADALGQAAAGSYRAALDRLSELPALRQTALTVGTSVDDIVTAYSNLVAVLLDLNRTVLADTREPLARRARGAEALTVAKEQISQQHAVLLAAILSGYLSDQQQSLMRTTEARLDAAVDEFRDDVPAEQQQRYDTVTGDVLIDRARLLDLALSRALQGAPLEISAADWNSAATASVDRIRAVETALLEGLRTDATTQGDEAGNAAMRDAVVVGALLLLAVLLLVLVVRSLLGPLRTLRTTAFDVADRRLPEAVEKLRRPGEQIGETVVNPVPVFSREEIGQVARAFDTVHVQAVRLAAEQAMLRSTINDIFLNLAGRSQRLVEQQLKLIDKLESAEQDPEQLSNLFQLDHLATRMRRNSENLLVLAGGELRRGAEGGVAVLDLLRAAVSEIAEYRRVTLRRPPAATVTGPVAGDLVHLIAELLDNATSAGPPDTPVTLSSALTEDGGLLVEIVDCGTGLPPGELHAINERLASPPVVDVSASRQMGLFVVSRLAARHRIRVRLRQQRGEFGITAVVQLPPSLVSTSSAESADPAPQRSATTEWSGTDVDLPLQVSVVEGTAEPDLFSPSSIGSLGFPRRRSPRTAEQEWLELFGRDEPDQAPLGPVEPAPSAPVAAQCPPPMPSGLPEPALEQPPQVREEIFEEVSVWFQERRSVPVGGSARNGDADETATPPVPAPEWHSAADAGWHAANALRTPVDHGVTEAGLPRRRPQTHLVPGSAGPSSLAAQDASPAPATRTPDDVRVRWSSYQRGLQHGRHARLAPDEVPARAYPPHRGTEEVQQ